MARVHRRFRPLCSATPVAAIGIIALIVAATLASACDPTEGAFGVTIVNDGPQSVRIKQCGSDCEQKFHTQATLRPTQRYRVNAAAGIPSWWLVEDASGNSLGCLTLPTKRSERDIPIDISDAGACPPRSSQPWWLGEALTLGAFVLFLVFGAAIVIGLLLNAREREKIARERALYRAGQQNK